jgi:hypothetical protein
MTSTRCFSKCAMAMGICAVSAASPAWALAGRSRTPTETGQQGDLVNQPGCWIESGYDGRFPCISER